MDRSSLIHYIDPSAIGITPNVNNSANDLEVYIAQGCKIQVYCPRAGLDYDAATNKPQEWTLKGRNRRLADSSKPYTVYARLNMQDKGDGYLVFAPKTPDDELGWKDEWRYLDAEKGFNGDEGSKVSLTYYFVRLGDVSLPENGERTVTLDTGLLGTEEFNNKWALNPDSLPLRIELQSTIADDQQPPVTRDGGTTPYVYWGETLTLTALLTEGWTGTDIQRFDHWEIRRDSGDAVADAAWNAVDRSETFGQSGVIDLIHGRGAETRDDFNSAVNTTFTVMAMERIEEATGDAAATVTEYAVLKQASFCIMAEVWEGYELSADTLMVTFNPRNGQYSPSGNIKFRIRATDQASDVFMMTNGQYAAAGLHAEYAPIDDSQNWTPITISGSESATAEGEVPATAFSTNQKSINVRLKNAAMKELDRFTIAFLKDGEDSREREWIYRLDTSAGYSNTTGTIGGDPSHPVSGQTGGVDNCRLVDDFVPENWTDEPTGTSSNHDTEYASYRDYDHDNDRWGAFATPKPWSHYGQDGDDGLYYKNEYARSKSRTSHAAADIDTSYGTSGWGTAAPSATDTYPYIWKRTRQWNPNTNNWATGSSWTYVCETGDDGKNSIRLALDNEHEDFLYSDSQALPIAPSAGATSAIHLYDGETEQSSGFTLEVDFTRSSGIPGSSAEHKPTISNGVLTVPHITADAAKVVVKATYKSKYYYADFTANKTSQDKYDLYVRPNAIPYNPASYTPMTLAFEAERTDLQGKKTSATISTSSSGRYVEGNLYLFFGYVKADGSIVNPTGGSTLYEWADIPIAASVCSAYVGIYFELRLYTSASAYRMCDHETVEIAKTQNGANAPYYVVDYGRASSRSLNQQGTPSGFDSTTGWQNTAPATSDNFPYIWERSRYYNSAGTLQSTSYTCLTGETGDDGISVFTDPTNILIRQVAKPQGNTDADFGLPMDVGFAVKEGKTAGTVTDVYIQSASGLTVIRKESDHTKAQITDVVPTGTVYPDKGHFNCRVSYTINGTSKHVDVKVPVYIDLMGSIVTTIEGDVERTVAHDVGYAIDPSGGIQSLDQVGTYIRSASEMTSELSKKVGEGKNLLTGVLTGEGWELTGSDIETNEDDEFIIGSGSLESPSGLSVGEEDGYYTLSYEAARAGTVQFYIDGVEVYDVPVTTGYLNGRYYLTFNTQWSDDYLDGELTFIFSGQTYIRHPQLETGEVATAFEAGSTETTSRIHQTAEQIDQSVRDDLGTVGIIINGPNKSIRAIGEKFSWENNNGDKILGLDNEGNGTFSGTVRAKNFYHNVCIFTEGVIGGAVGYSYSKYYCTSAPEGYSFQQGEYYTAEEIIAEIGSIPNNNFAQCVYDADVVHMIPTSGSVTGANWGYGSGLDDGKKTVTLPDPADFEGKIIEVYCDYYGDRSAGNAFIDCVQPNSFASHMHLGTDGHTLSVSWQSSREIVEGGVTVRFLSIEAYYDQTGETKHRWLIMGTSYDYPILEQLLQAHFDNRYQRLP